MQFDKTRYKVYTWKHWSIIHWMLNPGIVINELILGQRIPKISLIEQAADKNRTARGFVPCPHCETIHDARTWSSQNGTAYKNWFGLYCKTCGGIIPCVINVFSFLMLLLSYPIWGWFAKSLKSRWLEKQPDRYRNIDVENMPEPLKQMNWIKLGLIWGGCMFVLMCLCFPLLFNEEITTKKLLGGLVIFIIAGLLFGLLMKVFIKFVVKQRA